MTISHRRTGTPEYRSWQSMRQRCLNPTCPSYPGWGAKGIGIDPTWDDFEQFLVDMGPRPQGHTNERRNGKLDYGPTNCYWATSKEQNNNTSRNHWIEYDEFNLTLAQWCEELFLDHTLYLKRIKLGWSIGQALGVEDPPYNPKSHNGTSASRKLDTGVNYTTYKERLKSGWSEEDARKHVDGRAEKKNKHSNYIYVRHPLLGSGELTINQAAIALGKRPNTVIVAIRRGKTPLQALGLE